MHEESTEERLVQWDLLSLLALKRFGRCSGTSQQSQARNPVEALEKMCHTTTNQPVEILGCHNSLGVTRFDAAADRRDGL